MRNIDEINASWLTHVLRRPIHDVLSVDKVGTGQVALCYRVTFSAEDGQESVVIKIPSHDDVSRATAAFQRLYERETSFYKELAPSLRVHAPTCFFVDRTDDDDFVLVLEDMAPELHMTQFEGLSLEVARAGLLELVALHSPTLRRASVLSAPWLRGPVRDNQPSVASLIPGFFDLFLDRYDAVMTDDVRTVVTTLRPLLGVFSSYETPQPVVQHGDFRTDNLLFGARRGTVPVAVVDWQTVAVGSPLLDVAYFLVTSLDTADFAQHFEDLLDFYLSAMKESGTPLDNDVSRHEFVRYILQPVVMLVSAAVIVERTERGDRMFLTMIERAASAATLCQSVEALS